MARIKVTVDGKTLMDGGPQGWTTKPQLSADSVTPEERKPWLMTVLDEMTRTALDPADRAVDIDITTSAAGYVMEVRYS